MRYWKVAGAREAGVAVAGLEVVAEVVVGWQSKVSGGPSQNVDIDGEESGKQGRVTHHTNSCRAISHGRAAWQTGAGERSASSAPWRGAQNDATVQRMLDAARLGRSSTDAGGHRASGRPGSVCGVQAAPAVFQEDVLEWIEAQDMPGEQQEFLRVVGRRVAADLPARRRIRGKSPSARREAPQAVRRLFTEVLHWEAGPPCPC